MMQFETNCMDRLAAVRAELDKWQVDGLLITSGANRRWLSGFTGSSGQLLISHDRAILATDSRYWEQATGEAPGFALHKIEGDRVTSLREMLAGAGAPRIGFEAQQVTVHEFAGWQVIEAVTWLPLTTTLEPMRQIKSPAEIALMRAAAAIGDQAMSQVNSLAHPGMTERELAWALEKLLRAGGADGVAFEIIVASGPNSAMAHHRPDNRQLLTGDTIVIDMGALFQGYHSDLTRSFYLGAEPDDSFWQVYNVVLAAHSAVLERLRGGMDGKEADGLGRKVIADAGYGDNFGHGMGHGVGLEVHEGPRLSPSANDAPIPAGATVTVEPGIYLPGRGGIRIEDLVLVTDNGIELLSQCPKMPVIYDI